MYYTSPLDADMWSTEGFLSLLYAAVFPLELILHTTAYETHQVALYRCYRRLLLWNGSSSYVFDTVYRSLVYL